MKSLAFERQAFVYELVLLNGDRSVWAHSECAKVHVTYDHLVHQEIPDIPA